MGSLLYFFLGFLWMFLLLSPLIVYESDSHRLLTCSFCTFFLFNDMLGFYYFSILEEAIFNFMLLVVLEYSLEFFLHTSPFFNHMLEFYHSWRDYILFYVSCRLVVVVIGLSMFRLLILRCRALLVPSATIGHVWKLT